MRKLLVALLVTSTVLPVVNGEDTSVRGRLVRVPSSSEPSETARPKRSLFDRLFGPLPPATPTRRPTPTPAPVAKSRPKPKPKSVSSAAKKSDTSTATTEPKTPAPMTTKVAPTKASSKVKGSSKSPNLASMDDPAKFKAVKGQAMEDPALLELKNKADSEVDEAGANKALMDYNRALFRKVREIEPSLTDYADRVEQSMTKRIGAEKGRE